VKETLSTIKGHLVDQPLVRLEALFYLQFSGLWTDRLKLLSGFLNRQLKQGVFDLNKGYRVTLVIASQNRTSKK
jgi:hypothetical protein